MDILENPESIIIVRGYRAEIFKRKPMGIIDRGHNTSEPKWRPQPVLPAWKACIQNYWLSETLDLRTFQRTEESPCDP